MSAFSESGGAQQGALRQLGQMFGGAYIQAQEWNSIVDGLPMVATKIAKAMGTTREAMTFKIRQQSKDSPAYLISDIFPKLLKILPEIEAEFKNLPPTLDRTLNRAGVGLLKFSLNLKESVKMPELDAFYSRLDGTIQKIFQWADANKALIGTNINSFFKTLGDVLGSVDTQLKDTKGTAQILNDTFYILNGTVRFLKGTFDALLATLQLIKPIMQWIQDHPTVADIGGGAGAGAVIGSRGGVAGAGAGAGIGAIVGAGKSIVRKFNASLKPPNFKNKAETDAWIKSQQNPIFRGDFFPNPQAGFGGKSGGVTITQNNHFNGNSATKGEQKQTARMVHPATGNAVATAMQKRSVGH
jgi:tape measure domain-containing protein